LSIALELEGESAIAEVLECRGHGLLHRSQKRSAGIFDVLAGLLVSRGSEPDFVCHLCANCADSRQRTRSNSRH
jgi:hypothetical protein